MQLWRVLRSERPDVLHTHNPKPGIYGRIVGRLAGVPVIINTQHGLYATADDPLRKRLGIYALEAIAARFSDFELVQNPEDLTLLRRLRVVDRSKSRLLGNGVDLTRFDWHHPRLRGARDRIRRELGLDDQHILVGIVGRLVAEKGYPELFEAMREIGDEYALVVVGPLDPEKPDALSGAERRAAERDGVRFLGHRADVEALYQAMDVFVLPSHREGFPSPRWRLPPCSCPWW